MEAFKVPSELAKLTGSYPNAQDLLDAARKGGEASKIAVSRLWLSEGIPYAFKELPALYESVRSWLGTRLNVEPKEIHLTGSGRLGQSIAPQKLGQVFATHSDLDIFVISPSLFGDMKKDFINWSNKFESGEEIPRNSRESIYWTDNNQRGSKILQRGFIDSGIVPNREEYTVIRNISQTMWLLKKKLDITEGAPRTKGASIRCYRDWASYVQQTVLSIK